MTTRHAATAVLLACGILAAGTRGVSAQVAESEVVKLGTLPAQGVRSIVPSPDGLRLAYVLRRNNKDAVFCDGKELGEYDSVRDLSFSTNGKLFGFAAERARTWFPVVNGKEGEKYTMLRGPVFSPGGRTVACVVGLGPGRTYVVCNGVPQMKYAAVGQEPPVFSPDGKNLAFEARTSGRTIRPSVRDPNRTPPPNEPPPDWVTEDGAEVDIHSDSVPPTHFIVHNDRKGERCNDLHSPVFSPNSRILAYVARFADKWFVVVDGRKAGPLCDEIGQPVFSGDSRMVAYAGRVQKTWFVVCGREKDDDYDAVGQLCFSPDSQRLAYAAQQANQWFVVCEKKKGPACDDILWVGFSADGKHLAWVARKGHRQLMVCDGVEGPQHARIQVPEEAAGTADKLRYVAVDDEARLVEVVWPADRDWTHAVK